MNEENREFNKDEAKKFFQLIKQTKPPKTLFILAIVLSIMDGAASLILPLLTKQLVDQISLASLNSVVILIIAGVFLLELVASGFSYYLISYIGEWIVSSIRKRLWAHVIRLPVSYFDQHESGETMSRISQDTNIIKTFITQHFITFITGTIAMIGGVIILFIIDWKITLMMFVAIPLSMIVLIPLGRAMYKVSKSTQGEMAQFTAKLGRALTEIRLVKSFHGEEVEEEKGKKSVDELFRYGLKEAKILAVISPFMGMIIMVLVVFLIGYGGVRVASGTLSAGSLVAIIIYLVQIVLPFSQLATFFTAFQKALGATERIQQILSMETERIKNGIDVKEKEDSITFCNVSFSYKEDNPVLKNVSFHIPAGKTVAFVGPSGSGKTTIFSLLERFYKIDSGEILYGKENIERFDLTSWRKQIGYVSQESPIMYGTIRDNIAYGLDEPPSDEEILKAARLANAVEFIERFPDGLDTIVGERGTILSGGQRQRIAIARAIIKNPKILLLDEATSNLDSQSEHLVQEALSRLMKGRTTIVIAHRLSTVINADQIIVLEKGEITGSGTHEQLLQTNKLYKKLASQQLKHERVNEPL